MITLARYLDLNNRQYRLVSADSILVSAASINVSCQLT
ncbi:hypothetical protein YPPY66_1819 [Yersinia pestis PY-66]|uniref:Uncharacterized protein n=3 Tax=Yersinia pseudotuberculosis complex TaxID=1649845 RepID=A0A0U1R3G3_YERP3|nr:hypothetical protein YpsIP31758_2602 [Yersinia pseudotuberculosis IP 31758]ABX85249.1 hypothetical protein YpAngola_A1605 [Yersinia pestis Angola]ADV99345.1 hypothetical protein YPC_2806 [Yersinia pestis biovar Medievalis str. Harbin 35]EDR31761.1 hypothetical protein YPIP275_3817 [Yersinia pestis biovar Orientalis str. IP275]EDR40699.1 hypothetical protein YpF1991016_0297 [Yersinia pestis biovar Orientalis str. F1991016]EDR43531.1 hypothetical protein YpE1979001_2637 [Yersinia pestis biova